MEAGANDGLLSSNTAALERCFGWGGLLVEPDPRAFARLSQSRPRSTVVHGCLSGGDEERKLSLGTVSAMSTIEEGEGASPLAVIKEQENYPGEFDTVPVHCYPLHALLVKMGVQAVDFLSLDAEGSELSILSGIDWEAGPPIELISVETKLEIFGVDWQLEIRDFLERRGYLFLHRLKDDDLYARRHGNPLATQAQASAAASQQPPAERPWSRLGELLEMVLLAVQERRAGSIDKAAVEPIRKIAEDDSAEQLCPLGVLAARIAVALVDENIYDHWISKRRESTAALQVLRHEILYSSAQRKRLWSSSPPAPVGLPDFLIMEGRLPLPRLFLSDFDIFDSMYSDWPIFRAFDILSWHLHWVAPSVHIFTPFSGAGPCGASLHDFEFPEGVLMKADACGPLTLAANQLREAQRAWRDVQLSEARALILGAQLVLKGVAQRQGLYWLLFFSGGEAPTVWRRLADLSHQMMNGA